MTVNLIGRALKFITDLLAVRIHCIVLVDDLTTRIILDGGPFSELRFCEGRNSIHLQERQRRGSRLERKRVMRIGESGDIQKRSNQEDDSLEYIYTVI